MPLLALLALGAACTKSPRPRFAEVSEPPVWKEQEGRNEVRLRVVRSMLDENKPAEALPLIELMREEGADPLTVDLLQARALYLEGLFYEAQNVIESMTKRRQKTSEALQLMALIYADSGRVDQAIVLLQGVVQDLPDDAACHNNLGFLLFAAHRADEAIPVLQRAVRLESTNPLYRRNLGYALVVQGAPSRALQIFSTLGPPAEAQYHLGVAHEMRGETLQASDAYRAALEKNPGHVGAFEALARLQTPQEAPR